MQGKSAVESFIATERAKGASDQDIRHKLLDAGWHMDIIQWAMNDVTGERAQPAAPKINHTKEIALGSLFIFMVLGFRRFVTQARR